MRVGLVVASVAVLVIGIVKTTSPDSPLSREVVMSGFARNGEPLAVRLDMTVADLGSPVDIIYVPANQDVANAPFELTLFDDVESAEKEERLLQGFGGSKPLVARAKNALLIASVTLPPERRARLISTLESLR
jgi:hypothetical protein